MDPFKLWSFQTFNTKVIARDRKKSISQLPSHYAECRGALQTVEEVLSTMEQHTLKNANNCLNTNIYSYLETSGGQSSNAYLNVVHFLNTRIG
jgi:hypothetical protein